MRARKPSPDHGACSAKSALGLQLQQREFSALGEGEEYLSPTRTRAQALFGFAESPLAEQLRLQFGARVEHVEVDGTPASDVADVARLHASQRFGRPGVRCGRAGGWGCRCRRPRVRRRRPSSIARGVHEATATYETGLPCAAAGAGEFRSKPACAGAAGACMPTARVWVTDFSNFIYGELTGRSCSEEGDCVVGRGRGAHRAGLHAARCAIPRCRRRMRRSSCCSMPRGDLHLNLLADVVRARLNGGAGNVPRIPPCRVGAGFSWHGERIDASVFLKYSGKQDRVATAETPTGGFTNLDAEFAFRPWAQRPRIEIALVGRNLTDSLQRNAVALNKDEVQLPGRDLRLVLRATLD